MVFHATVQPTHIKSSLVLAQSNLMCGRTRQRFSTTMGLTRVLLEAERQLRGDRAGDADGLSRRARSFRGQRYEPEESGRTQDTARS